MIEYDRILTRKYPTNLMRFIYDYEESFPRFVGGRASVQKFSTKSIALSSAMPLWCPWQPDKHFCVTQQFSAGCDPSVCSCFHSLLPTISILPHYHFSKVPANTCDQTYWSKCEKRKGLPSQVLFFPHLKPDLSPSWWAFLLKGEQNPRWSQAAAILILTSQL